MLLLSTPSSVASLPTCHCCSLHFALCSSKHLTPSIKLLTWCVCWLFVYCLLLPLDISSMRVKSLQSCLTLCDTIDCSRQAPLSMGLSRQECSPPGDLPNSRIEPSSLTSPALAGEFFTISTTWGSQLHKDRNFCSSLDSYHLEQCLAHTRSSLLICWRKERRGISHRKPSWLLLRDKTLWFRSCGLLHFSLPQLSPDWVVTVHYNLTGL